MNIEQDLQAEIIVEIGNTHEGSVGIAQCFIEMAANAGAKIIKFQMHIAEKEGIENEPFRVKFSAQDKTRQEYWRRINFKVEDWIYLAEYCRKLNVEFLCTPFSIDSAKVLLENNLVKRWKVGSGQATDFPLIDYLISTKMPLIISTGLISEKEIGLLKNRLINSHAWDRTTLMHCVSKYPVPITEIDLPLMKSLKSLGCKVGYSDHSGSEIVIYSAITMGASIIEIHMTPRPDFFGPDVSSSHTPEQISRIVSFAKIYPQLATAARTKDEHFESVAELRKLFRKGIYWAKNKKSGEMVELSDLHFLKPVGEVDVIDFEKFLGKRLCQDVVIGSPLRYSDFPQLT
jgi:N-acetylneuraminate synthase